MKLAYASSKNDACQFAREPEEIAPIRRQFIAGEMEMRWGHQRVRAGRTQLPGRELRVDVAEELSEGSLRNFRAFGQLSKDELQVPLLRVALGHK